MNDVKRLYEGVIHECKREAAASQRVSQEVDGDAGCHDALHDPHAPDICFGETTRHVGLEDPPLDQAAQLIRADASPIGRLGKFVAFHDRTVCAQAAPSATAGVSSPR